MQGQVCRDGWAGGCEQVPLDAMHLINFYTKLRAREKINSAVRFPP